MAGRRGPSAGSRRSRRAPARRPPRGRAGARRLRAGALEGSASRRAGRGGAVPPAPPGSRPPAGAACAPSVPIPRAPGYAVRPLSFHRPLPVPSDLRPPCRDRVGPGHLTAPPRPTKHLLPRGSNTPPCLLAACPGGGLTPLIASGSAAPGNGPPACSMFSPLALLRSPGLSLADGASLFVWRLLHNRIPPRPLAAMACWCRVS